MFVREFHETFHLILLELVQVCSIGDAISHTYISICNSMGQSEIWDKFHKFMHWLLASVVARMAMKLH